MATYKITRRVNFLSPFKTPEGKRKYPLGLSSLKFGTRLDLPYFSLVKWTPRYLSKWGTVCKGRSMVRTHKSIRNGRKTEKIKGVTIILENNKTQCTTTVSVSKRFAGKARAHP